jgi:hypothetical protein
MRGLGKSLYREAGGSSSERVTYPGHEQTYITTQSVTHARSPAMRVLSILAIERRDALPGKFELAPAGNNN